MRPLCCAPKLNNYIAYMWLVCKHQRYSGKHFRHSRHAPVVNFDPDGRWREVVAKQLTLSFPDKEQNVNTYLMIPLVDNPHRDRLAIVASNLDVRHWVFGCIASSWHKSVRFCEKGVDLSDQSLLLPPTGDKVKRKMMYIDLNHLRGSGFTHAIINIPKSQDKASIQFDVHRSFDRNVIFPSNPWAMSSVSLSIPADVMIYNVTLPDLKRPWQSLKVTARGAQCQDRGNALIRKIVPWSRENEFYLANNSIAVQLHAPKSPQWADDESVQLQFLIVNQCHYEIKISTNWVGIGSQLVRFYSPCLLSMVVAIFISCFSRQLAAKEEKLPVPSTLQCLLQISVLRTTLIPQAVATVLGFVESRSASWWPLPLSDDSLLHADNLGLPLVYVLMGAVAWIVAIIITSLFWVAILVGGTAMHSLLIRYLRAGLGVSALIAELVTLSLTRVPLVVSVALTAVAISTCGSVALLLGCIFCIWKMFAYYEDQLEAAVIGSVGPVQDGKDADDDGKDSEAEDAFSLNNTISLMWICTTVLCLPTLIVWIKNPNLAVPNDPSLMVSIAWSIFGMIIWQKTSSSDDGMISYGRLAALVSILSTVQLIYGLFSLYRIKYFVTSVIALYALKQLL